MFRYILICMTIGSVACATYGDSDNQSGPPQHDGWGEAGSGLSPTGSEWFINGGSTDGTDGTDSLTPGCTPECDGKQCGSNGCGGSCGQCSNPHPCRDSVCSVDHQCAEIKRTDPPFCNGVFFFKCQQGELKKVSCIDECKQGGWNKVAGCGTNGASTTHCNCSTDEKACNVDYRECSGNGQLSGCLKDEGVWYTVTCEGLCKQGGHHSSVGCTNSFGCVCVDEAADGALCKPKGQPCGTGSGIASVNCCDGMVCGGDSKNPTCVLPKSCPKKCLNSDGMCCGGALCSGGLSGCLGNPCCT